jgi:iron complex outermembrane recepter protein
MKLHKAGGVSLLTLAAMLMAMPALAQDQQGASPGDIIVTAQKRSERLQEVPIAVSAVGSEFLQSRDISSIDRLGSVAPNVKIERAPSNKTISQISIRGSVTINPAITWEPAVGLYMDGVYIAKAQGSIFDVADLERIEVLRGPQGTLYGRNTLAGAVNLITKKPTGELGGFIEGSYGDYNYHKIKGSLNLPKYGIFSVKLSGQIQKRDGFIDVVDNPYPAAILANPRKTDEQNDLDSHSFMAQVRAEPTDNLTLDYTFDYSNFDQKTDYAQLYRVNRNGDPRDIFDPASPSYAFAGAFFPLNLYDRKDRQDKASLDANLFERSKATGHALTATWDVGGVTLKSITAYRNLRWDDSLDLDGSPLDVAATQRFTKYHAFSQELQATGALFDDDRLKYVVGLFYFKDKAETDNPQRFFGGATSFRAGYGSHTEAYAAYAQVDYNLTEKLTLTGGLRYNHEEKDIKRYLELIGTGVLIDVPYGGVPDATANNLSPQFTVKYAFTRDFNVYARYAKGFKSGGFNGETNIAGTDPGSPGCAAPAELTCPYKPEKVDSYEIGFKSQWFDRRLTLNSAFFWDEHKDIQLSIFTATGAAASVVKNAAQAQIRGVEVEVTARPIDTLTLNASVAYLDAEYKKYIEAGVDVSNNRAFPHTPEYTASFGADWEALRGDWGKLNLVGDVSYVDEYYTYPYPLRTPTLSDQNANNTKSPGRTIVNLTANVTDIPLGRSKANVSLWARNVFEEDRPQNFIDFGPGFGGLTVAYFPDPRTVGVTIGARF